MLLSNLNLLATAPDGVARLRELILTLAVQGKLLPQDAKDEAASVLLKKIRAEKDRLIAEKKIRRLKPLDPIDESETGFALPSSWEWERLGNLGDWGAGATPSRSNSSYYGGDIPWFKSGELNADFISESEETVTDAALRNCSLRLNQVGDVLVAMYGATIGKTAILSVVATTNQAVCACTPFAGLLNTYLLLLMKALKPYFISIGAGGAQPNISREKVIATVIGLPPLAEQSRIVTRVEELMRLCDALEAKTRLEATQHEQLVRTLLSALTISTTPEELTDNWHRVATHFDLLLDRPEAVDALEQTILQLAVRGLLVPQDPQDEPASTLLQKIRLEKDRLIAEGKIKRDKPLPPIAEDEKPFDLPKRWEWARVGSIGATQTGGTPASNRREYFDGDFPFIGPGQITPRGNILSAEKFISERGRLESAVAEIGDVLMVCIGGSIGKCAAATFATAFNQQINSIHPVLTSSAYVLIAMSSSDFMGAVIRAATGSATPIISKGKWDVLLLPVPPLAEQSRIVDRVASLRALCADLRQRLSTARTQQALLAEVLVQTVSA